MNIVQAYTKFKKQNIILISGFSGSQKTKIAKFIAKLFGFQLVSLIRFYKPSDVFAIDNYIILKNEKKVLNWDNIYKSVDWDKFNTFINENREKGIVVHGFGFPSKLLSFKPDFHIHVTIGKQKLMENREEYVKKHSRSGEIRNDIKSDIHTLDKLLLNTVTYPIYLTINKESIITEYINSNDLSIDQMKDKAFNYLIKAINNWLQTNSEKSKSKPIQKLNQFDEFYYPNKKNLNYDFNNDGKEYPEKIHKKSSDSSSSDTTFLFTSKD